MGEVHGWEHSVCVADRLAGLVAWSVAAHEACHAWHFFLAESEHAEQLANPPHDPWFDIRTEWETYQAAQASWSEQLNQFSASTGLGGREVLDQGLIAPSPEYPFHLDQHRPIPPAPGAAGPNYGTDLSHEKECDAVAAYLGHDAQLNYGASATTDRVRQIAYLISG